MEYVYVADLAVSGSRFAGARGWGRWVRKREVYGCGYARDNNERQVYIELPLS